MAPAIASARFESFACESAELVDYITLYNYNTVYYMK